MLYKNLTQKKLSVVLRNKKAIVFALTQEKEDMT